MKTKPRKDRPGRGCIIFSCEKRQGFYCCADCEERDVCDDPCHNGPERCGQVTDVVDLGR